MPVKADSAVTFCSLNLYRFGEKGFKKETGSFLTQKKFLVKRLNEADCDVVGLQEIAGKSRKESEKIIKHLVDEISSDLSMKDIEVILADSNDSWNRNGYLYDSNLFILEEVKHWNRQSLPKFDYRSHSWNHTRGPVSILLSLKSKPEARFFVVNFHLKSKARGWKDPTGTNYEYARLLSAGGIRKIINDKIHPKYKDSSKILLGDRNTNTNGAASEILSGRLKLSDFSMGNSCRVSPYGTALCKPDTYRNPDMIPIIQRKGVESKKFIGTYKIRKKEEILDEIYIEEGVIGNARNKSGILQAGVTGEYRKGSDHLLSWVKIRL